MYNRSLVYYNEALELYCGEICKSPRTAIIYVVYGCNFSCEGCLCSAYNTEKIYMDFEKFKQLTVELKKQGVKSIEFCGGGEPLLHPDIKKMISWVTDHLHLSLGIMTNGSMIDDELAYLIVTRVDYIRISVYPNSYKMVVKKIEKLTSMRELLEGDVIIGAKFLVNRSNEGWVYDRVSELSQNKLLDLISVKALRGDGDIVDYSDVEERIKSIGNEKISVNLSKSYLKCKCWMSPIHTLIDPVGDVYICCYYMDRKDSHCIGNVFEKPFSQIWGSREHMQKIEHIDKNKCNVFDCRWHGYNEQMLELLRSKSHHQFC